jgi:PKD repeat protein
MVGIKKDLCLLFLMMSFKVLFGQISENTFPESFSLMTKSSVVLPESVLDSIHVAQLLAEDSKFGIPNRYGVVEDLVIDIKDKGVKTINGDVSIWRYAITCPDAVSLGVYFKSYIIPERASVYVYSSDGDQLRGGFTSANNKTGGSLAIAEIPGTNIIIEYNEPAGVEFEGELVVGSVSKSYTELEAVANDWIQINCPDGDDWQSEKHSVCLMSYSEARYSYYCTGSLVNNVREDETPYFLTANHCISSNTVANTLVTYFNYENSTCDGDDASLKQSLSGAELMATNDHSDFTLLKLSEYPSNEYEPYYAGWNASDDLPETGTCIHQPEGSYKCIALDYDAPVSYAHRIQWDDDNITDSNTHWEVEYDAGTDESGSSGGPLFDENKRILGQLHGGDDVNSYFGKFSVSWDYSSVSSAQLKNWLDPDNTGTEILDGLGYSGVPFADFETDVTLACLNSTVYFSDLSTHNPSQWAWSFQPETVEFISGTDSSSQNPEVSFLEEGLYSVTLVVGNEYGKDTIVYEDLIDAVADLDVSFPDFDNEIYLCGSELQDYLMVATGANEYAFEVSEADNFDIEIIADSIILNLKDEVRQYGSFDTYVKVIGSHGNCSASDSVLLHVVMPANDDIEYAEPLLLGRNAYYSNECGTVEDDEPVPGNLELENSVWFTFMGPSTGLVSVEVEGADVKTAVYEADSYSKILSGVYTLLGASNEDYFSETVATIENLSVEFGKTYWLQVDGYDGDYGDLTINLLSNTIEVYPNPSSGMFYLTVSSEEGGTAELAVYSINGQLVLSTTKTLSLDSNTLEMDLSGHPAGMYIFRAIINGVQMTKKLILSR